MISSPQGVDRAGTPANPRPPAFLISTTGCARDIRRHMGSADYSYVFVLNALRPVLERLGPCHMVEAPESRLAALAARFEADGYRPIHLALQPLQSTYFPATLPTFVFPFWEFPDVPDQDFAYDTRQNWARLSRAATTVLVACRFTADALRRLDISCPVEVVPVPLGPEPFETPAWDPDFSWTLDCRHLIWGGPPSSPAQQAPVQQEVAPKPPARRTRSLKHGLRMGYRRHVRPWLSDEAIARISALQKSVLRLPETPLPLLPTTSLTLSGLVYTSIFNLSDRRKNVSDLLTAFLIAFRDRADVTLVLKLATSPTREYHELIELGTLYHSLGIEHRCRVVVLTDYLSDEQLQGLLRATTFYVNSSRAEGACLPLQQALASGRPALAPSHTAMADYMDPEVGFVLESHPEPTFWPHDPTRRHRTTWHRLAWSSLRDGFLKSADLWETDPRTYLAMGEAARRRLAGYAGRDVVAESLRGVIANLNTRLNPKAERAA